ncbi:MAG TPA: hypothetical protein VH583_20200 [Vicinamibacterales bacterium]|jgi:hypothetical protein
MIGEALAGGVLGTFVLATLFRLATELGLTRLDFALILGTLVTSRRRRARALGYLLQVALGMLFAVAYALLFLTIGWSTWWFGALLGLIHAVFVATVLLNVLLPAIHPTMGTPGTSAKKIVLIEPPGFLMHNYGPNTFAVMLVTHAIFGAILGWIIHV